MTPPPLNHTLLAKWPPFPGVLRKGTRTHSSGQSRRDSRPWRKLYASARLLLDPDSRLSRLSRRSEQARRHRSHPTLAFKDTEKVSPRRFYVSRGLTVCISVPMSGRLKTRDPPEKTSIYSRYTLVHTVWSHESQNRLAGIWKPSPIRNRFFVSARGFPSS